MTSAGLGHRNINRKKYTMQTQPLNVTEWVLPFIRTDVMYQSIDKIIQIMCTWLAKLTVISYDFNTLRLYKKTADATTILRPEDHSGWEVSWNSEDGAVWWLVWVWDFAAEGLSKLNVPLEPVAGELSSKDRKRLISSPIHCGTSMGTGEEWWHQAMMPLLWRKGVLNRLLFWADPGHRIAGIMSVWAPKRSPFHWKGPRMKWLEFCTFTLIWLLHPLPCSQPMTSDKSSPRLDFTLSARWGWALSESVWRTPVFPLLGANPFLHR